jgi:hypothetical protein
LTRSFSFGNWGLFNREEHCTVWERPLPPPGPRAPLATATPDIGGGGGVPLETIVASDQPPPPATTAGSEAVRLKRLVLQAALSVGAAFLIGAPFW